MSRKFATRVKNGNNRNTANEALDPGRVVQDAMTLFGDGAPTAVAFWALEAWCEEKEEEYRFWSKIFLRMRN